MRQRLIEGALRETKGRAGDRRAKYIERAHRQLETLSFGAHAMRRRNAAAGERQRGERMGCDDVDAAFDLESRSIRIDHERADSASGHGAVGPEFRRTRAREDAIEVGDPAVGYPGLLAVQHVGVAVEPRAALNGGDVGSGLRLRQREGGDRLSGRDAREISCLEFRRTREGDGAAAQALHGEGKIREAVVPCKGFADERQRADVELPSAQAPCGEGRRIAGPASAAELGHECAASRIDRGPVFRVRAISAMRLSAQASSRSASSRCPGSKNGHSRKLRTRMAGQFPRTAASVSPRKPGTRGGNPPSHADGLRFGLGVDRGIDGHRSIPCSIFFVIACANVGPGGDFGSECERFLQHFSGATSRLKNPQANPSSANIDRPVKSSSDARP
jgi:hypothetical protein